MITSDNGESVQTILTHTRTQRILNKLQLREGALTFTVCRHHTKKDTVTNFNVRKRVANATSRRRMQQQSSAPSPCLRATAMQTLPSLGASPHTTCRCIIRMYIHTYICTYVFRLLACAARALRTETHRDKQGD